MKNLLDRLPADARRKILSGKAITNEDDEEDEEEEEEGWGRKKSAYWSADTADLEIGQDVQDAEDEELAVKDLQKQTLKKMKENDFYDRLSASESDDESVDLRRKKSSGKSSKKSDKLTSELQILALGKQVTDATSAPITMLASILQVNERVFVLNFQKCVK